MKRPLTARGTRSVAPILLFLLAAALGLPAPVQASTSGLRTIDAALRAGEIDPDQALLYRFQQVFHPERLPASLRSDERVRCLHPLVREYDRRASSLRPAVREQIAAFLTPPPTETHKKATHVSDGGNFEISYSTTGTNGVPATDVAPANGIPDFVEQVAAFCDFAWEHQVNILGFAAPDLGGGRYQVSFEKMGSYGYTTTHGAVETRIVLHNNFIGFPPNDDPAGNAIGAAKVTIAHEFKHATQFAASGWSEGNWLELDATWIEDIEYDYVNDYYNYLPSGSPISNPDTPLDSGGGGSYEDCVWEHYMSQTHSDQIIVDLWTHRETNMGLPMFSSYQTLLQANGSSFARGFREFAAWNYATGTRAATGFGYDEAASYPTAPLHATLNSYPGHTSGSVQKLAANLVRATGLSGLTGTLDVDFTSAPGSSVEVVAVIVRTDGVGVMEHLPQTANAASMSLSTPLDQIAEVGFAISNASAIGSPQAWNLTVSESPAEPQPTLSLDTGSWAETLQAGGTGVASLLVTNTGDAGSSLDYQILVMESLPANRTVARNIIGSTLTASATGYTAGLSTDVTFTVTNASPDEEWLTGISLIFPAGVTVNSTTDFLGGTDGPLMSDGTTGDGVTVTWTDGNGGFGNIYGGEQAAATLNLSFDPGLAGDLVIESTIYGDEWGGLPHSVAGSVTLLENPPEFTVTSPNGGQFFELGSVHDITWTTSGVASTVDIEVSHDGGGVWSHVATGVANTGTYAWTTSGPASGQCLVRVGSAGSTDSCDAAFTLYRPVLWLNVGAPASGSLAEGASLSHDLHFDSASLLPGTHPATVVILHNGEISPTVIPFSLEVTDPLVPTPQMGRGFRLDPAYPNPFNPTTTISYALPTRGHVRLQIYDLAGRLVDVLVDETKPAGEHRVAWHGTDRSGRPVSSGMYLYRIATTDHVAHHRMVLVR